MRHHENVGLTLYFVTVKANFYAIYLKPQQQIRDILQGVRFLGV